VHIKIITYTYIFVFDVALNETVSLICSEVLKISNRKKFFSCGKSYEYAMFFFSLKPCYFFVIK